MSEPIFPEKKFLTGHCIKTTDKRNARRSSNQTWGIDFTWECFVDLAENEIFFRSLLNYQQLQQLRLFCKQISKLFFQWWAPVFFAFLKRKFSIKTHPLFQSGFENKGSPVFCILLVTRSGFTEIEASLGVVIKESDKIFHEHVLVIDANCKFPTGRFDLIMIQACKIETF